MTSLSLLTSPTNFIHPPSPPKVPAASLSYVPAHRSDDDVFRRRYLAIRNIIHELEDENNLVAYRIAKIKRKRREREAREVREAQEAQKREAQALEEVHGEEHNHSHGADIPDPELRAREEYLTGVRRSEAEMELGEEELEDELEHRLNREASYPRSRIDPPPAFPASHNPRCVQHEIPHASIHPSHGHHNRQSLSAAQAERSASRSISTSLSPVKRRAPEVEDDMDVDVEEGLDDY